MSLKERVKQVSRLLHGILVPTAGRRIKRSQPPPPKRVKRPAPKAGLTEEDKQFIVKMMADAKKASDTELLEKLAKLLAEQKSTVVLTSDGKPAKPVFPLVEIEDDMVNVTQQDEVEGQVTLQEDETKEDIAGGRQKLKDLLGRK